MTANLHPAHQQLIGDLRRFRGQWQLDAILDGSRSATLLFYIPSNVDRTTGVYACFEGLELETGVYHSSLGHPGDAVFVPTRRMTFKSTDQMRDFSRLIAK